MEGEPFDVRPGVEARACELVLESDSDGDAGELVRLCAPEKLWKFPAQNSLHSPRAANRREGPLGLNISRQKPPERSKLFTIRIIR